VLITGVGKFWGSHLARQLENDHSLDFVCAVDTRDAQGDFGRTEIVRGDIRNPSIARLINVTRVDTVVHTQIFGANHAGESSRLLHDMNVIGTMNLLAACASSPYVRKVIIRSSTSIYGASPRDPAFFTEDMESRLPLRDQYSRDIQEVETYARDYAKRAPQSCVTILRYANSIGESVETPFTNYLASQIVPTIAGYNPRMQFIMDSDAVAALAHGVRVWRPGVFNIAGPGIVTLKKFLRMAGRIPVPVVPPAFAPVLRLLSRTDTPLYVPSRYDEVLRYGRGVKTDRMREEFGFTPEFTTPEAAEKYANYIRVRRYHDRGDEPMFDRELLDYVQRKMQQMPAPGAEMLTKFAARATGLADDSPDGGNFGKPRTFTARSASSQSERNDREKAGDSAGLDEDDA
jgi:UDP-glucose 4-epimerase